MSGWKKLAAASAAGGGGLDVDEVFSTYVYAGNNSSRTITNGIDLAGEGGWVVSKVRDSGEFAETASPDLGTGGKILRWGSTNGVQNDTDSINGFTSSGFTIGGADTGVNAGAYNYVSWTFRKAPKFFDIQTISQVNSTYGLETKSHSLGVNPAFILIKRTDSGGNWFAWHYDGTTVTNNFFNSTQGSSSNNAVQNVTSTTVDVNFNDVGNGQGSQYVMYLFAHNDGDGEFGPDGDQDIIKCGSYTTNSSADASIDLGFEPQWVLFKTVNDTSNWKIVDSMRGLEGKAPSYPYGSFSLSADSSSAEVAQDNIYITPTGFEHVSGFANKTLIYMAIRRGSLFPPESATEVFDIDTWGGASAGNPMFSSGFPVDMSILKGITGTNSVNTARLMQGYGLYADTIGPNVGVSYAMFDYMDGWGDNTANEPNFYSWMWKRAPGYFDVLAYTGTSSSASHTVNHNLGVAPEFVWIKRRDGTSSWRCYHNDGSTERTVYLESTLQGFSNSTLSSVGATSFVVNGGVLDASAEYIMYLFATLPGISKVGGYTGNGSSQTINCGFTSGARFILVKRTDSTGDWYVWDSVRGIVAGNDPYLELNTTDAEVTSTDWVDPDNSGFIVNGTTINASSAEYIFYAVA